MTNPRDDMVIRPRLGREPRAAAPVRAREERRVARMRKKGGVLHRIAKFRLAQKTARVASALRLARAARMARAGSAAARFGGRAAANPVGAIIAGVAVASIVAVRLISGMPFEGIGERINQMFLGDLDEEARAKMATRNEIESDRDILRIVAKTGAKNAQVRSIFKDLYQLNLRKEKAAALFRREFPINNTLDLIILGAKNAFLQAWNGTGGPETVDTLAKRLGDAFGHGTRGAR